MEEKERKRGKESEKRERKEIEKREQERKRERKRERRERKRKRKKREKHSLSFFPDQSKTVLQYFTSLKNTRPLATWWNRWKWTKALDKLKTQ